MIHAAAFPWAPKPEVRMEWLSAELRAKINPREYVQARYREALDEVPGLTGEDVRSARMREIFYLSLTRWMPTLLDRKDRMSMAFGLEVRVPFCDHRLVEYVWNVPWHMKNYENREKGLGFCRRNMDIPRKKLRKNTKDLSVVTKRKGLQLRDKS